MLCGAENWQTFLKANFSSQIVQRKLNIAVPQFNLQIFLLAPTGDLYAIVSDIEHLSQYVTILSIYACIYL